MWQTELWHPVIVHLPIVTLLLASTAGLFQYIIKNSASKLFTSQMVKVMLVLGVVSGWIGIYSGQLAYNIEIRKICDPKALQEHQWWSYISLIIFSAALLIVLFRTYYKSAPAYLKVVTAILMIAGGGALLYAGHLGAAVVYQQGAGVHKPKEDCSDYIVN
ncbi:DUF2231 domain-containing protein [Flavobacterium hauense]